MSRRVKDHHVGIAHDDALEEGEIRRGLHRFLVDEVVHHLLLISVDHAQHAVTHGLSAEVRGIDHLTCPGLQLLLHDRELFDSGIALSALDGIVRGHGGIGGLDSDRLDGIDGEIDDLLSDAQAVELRSFGGSSLGESEGAVSGERGGIHFLRTVQGHVLEVENRVLGIGDVTLNLDLIALACGDANGCQQHCGCRENAKKLTFHFIVIYFQRKNNEKKGDYQKKI